MPFGFRQFALAVCSILLTPILAAAQFRDVAPLDSPEPAPMIGPSGGIPYSRPVLPVRSQMAAGQTQQYPQWKIPAGKYGLQLANGTRITGQPVAGWSATFKTSFGTVSIPLPQISHIAPSGSGLFSAYLKNGDRVTGTLVSSTLKFETQFGSLQVAAADIVRLLTSNQSTPSPPNGSKTTTGTTVPGKPLLPIERFGGVPDIKKEPQ